MKDIILASASSARLEMLQNAGVSVSKLPAAVDEQMIKASMLAEGHTPRDIADALAEAKAWRVVNKRPDAMILGADQVLVCDGKLYDKPETPEEAREQLISLRGKTHELLSAAVIYDEAEPVWRHIGRAQLVMRPFSDAFLDDYIARRGDDLLTTVGCYKLEGQGVQLFSRVQGDYFTVLGLPLLEVLGFLRARGVLVE